MWLPWVADFGTATWSSCRASTSQAQSGPQLALGVNTGFIINPITMERKDLSVKASITDGGAGGAPWTVTWHLK
jgi:hypothetical protein